MKKMVSEALPRSELQAEDVENAIGGDGDTLVAVEGERDGIGADTAAGLEFP